MARDEEIRRIVPIIEALTAQGHIVSADTRHTNVMRHAAQAGAPIINDVAGFRDEGAEALLPHYRKPPQVAMVLPCICKARLRRCSKTPLMILLHWMSMIGLKRALRR